MPNDFEELKRKLLQSDEEFRQLATQHHELDERIHSLASRHYLSEPEQLEEVTAEPIAAEGRNLEPLGGKAPISEHDGNGC